MCTQRHTDPLPTHKDTCLSCTLTFSLTHVLTPSLIHSHTVTHSSSLLTVSFTCPLPPCLPSAYTPLFPEHTQSMWGAFPS